MRACETCQHWTRYEPTIWGHCALARAYLALGMRRAAVSQRLGTYRLYKGGCATPEAHGFTLCNDACEQGYEPSAT